MLSGRLGYAPAYTPPKERVSIADVTSPLASMRERPTFTQAFGARMLNLLLWVICGLVVAFLLAWLITRPTLMQVQSALGAHADSKAVLETLREMQRDHADQFRSFFQFLVLSELVPLITLFARYIFGAHEDARQSTSQNTEPHS